MTDLNGRLRLAILERDGYRCVYCGRPAADVALEVDHYIPRAAGGRDYPDNLVTACRDCNNAKRATTINHPSIAVVFERPMPAWWGGRRTAPPGSGEPRRQRVPDGRWVAEAQRRWPDAMDLSWISGMGQFATVTWCAGLTVVTWNSRAAAEKASVLRGDSCGHQCWRDHEYVDLSLPQEIDPETEGWRLGRRLAHFANCRVCEYVFGGQASAAAEKRTRDRLAARSSSKVETGVEK